MHCQTVTKLRQTLTKLRHTVQRTECATKLGINLDTGNLSEVKLLSTPATGFANNCYSNLPPTRVVLPDRHATRHAGWSSVRYMVFKLIHGFTNACIQDYRFLFTSTFQTREFGE